MASEMMSSPSIRPALTASFASHSIWTQGLGESLGALLRELAMLQDGLRLVRERMEADGQAREGVASLPLDRTSTFIRSSFNGMGPQNAQYFASMMRSQQLRALMLDQLQLFKDGKLLSYYDILNTSR